MRNGEGVGADVFLQEATELLQGIERGLLNLEAAPHDGDLLNAIFRDLHTVKGSGGMFGHTEMAQFAHAFEDAFDQLRRGSAEVTPGLIAVALRACDQIQRLISNSSAEGSAAILDDLRRELGGAPKSDGWRLKFYLGRNALRLGADPRLVLEEFQGLGATSVSALLDRVGPLDQLDPTDCLMGWDIRLPATVDRSAIDDVFLFLSDEMELSIEPPTSPETVANEQATSAAVAAPTVTHPGPARPPVVQTMRVATERLDILMDRVGELVIADARLQALAHSTHDPALLAIAEDIQRLSAGLRDATMSMRMVPIGTIFDRFRRLMRDLSHGLDKPFEFTTAGEDTEIDKTVIELLADPLVHILRNAADHGIDTAEERLAAGKPRTARIELSAAYSGAEILITVRDDGRGLDAGRIRERAIARGLLAPDDDMGPMDLCRLIFQPGFSTAEKVTELSGRGVGMDVVKRTIETLRGQIDLASEPGHGTTVTLRLPLTLAIIDGMLVEVGGERYTLPLSAVEECVELPPQHATASGTTSFLNIRGALVPFLRLRQLFSVTRPAAEFQKVVIVTAQGVRLGLVVDRIIGNNQTVIKQLSLLHAGLRSFSGATIMGDGTVSLILDVSQLARLDRAVDADTRRERAA